MIEKTLEVFTKTTEYALYAQFREFADFKDLFKTLATAGEGDQIILRLSSYGGRIDIGSVLIDHIKESPAEVHMVVDNPCYSMGAVLALCGDSLTMKPNTLLMFHDYSTFMSGKGNEIKRQLDCEHPLLHDKFRKWCKPFLTEKELKKFISGEDLYIRYDDATLKDRAERHYKIPRVNRL